MTYTVFLLIAHFVYGNGQGIVTVDNIATEQACSAMINEMRVAHSNNIENYPGFRTAECMRVTKFTPVPR